MSLTRDEARFIGLLVAHVDGTASVDVIDEGGATPARLVLYDKMGEVIGEQGLGADDLTLP